MNKNHYCNRVHIIGALVVILGTLLAWTGLRQKTTLTESHMQISNASQAGAVLQAAQEAGIKKIVLAASPKETLSLEGNGDFSDHKANFDQVMQMSVEHPEYFTPFCTLNPLDEDMMDQLMECYQRGSRGIKLYNGHSHYHEVFGIPLNDEKMQPVYELAQEKNLPIIFHVNVPRFEEELRAVLDTYPDLKVSVPQYMIASMQLDRLRSLLNDYPNLYTDTGFGADPFMAAGFRRFSNGHDEYRQFFEDYADRILFSAGMVIGEANPLDTADLEARMHCYRNLLSSNTFRCEPVSDYYLDKYDQQSAKSDSCPRPGSEFCKMQLKKTEELYEWVLQTRRLKGLDLPNKTAKKIFTENTQRFLKRNGS